MSEDRLIAAFGRLDRALGRVEQAAARPLPASPDAAGVDPGLAARHARLRRAAEAAVAELDSLIGDR